jgi:hypothetical protein
MRKSVTKCTNIKTNSNYYVIKWNNLQYMHKKSSLFRQVGSLVHSTLVTAFEVWQFMCALASSLCSNASCIFMQEWFNVDLDFNFFTKQKLTHVKLPNYRSFHTNTFFHHYDKALMPAPEPCVSIVGSVLFIPARNLPVSPPPPMMSECDDKPLFPIVLSRDFPF